ncbi:MAG: PleD family two-component system response regulator, partial [Kiloniellales bacterium]
MTARVLIVDDHLPNVRLLEAKLTAEYFDVVTANDGPSALTQVERHSPDIILLDVMMPGMDGYEVCKRLKDDPKSMHIPVVMVTALRDAPDRVHGLEVGADDFLTKPVNDTALLARVRSLIRLKLMMDEWRQREQTSGELGVFNDHATMATENTLNARILVVEDRDIEADKIRETLAQDRHHLDCLSSDAEANERALRNDYDLIIISLALRGQDPLRLCSQLRSAEQTRQVPILLVGDEQGMSRVAKGLDLGANDYLLRPMDRNELLARTRTQIRRRRYQDRLRANYQNSLAMALTDSLTGLYNRRYLVAHAARLVERTRAAAKPLAVLLIDIDHFKQVNDNHGHAVGDEVLRQVAARMNRSIRTVDMLARFGGEEFVVLMPNTRVDLARMVAGRLHETIANTPFETGVGSLSITISIGVTEAMGFEETVDSLLKRADDAL